MNRRTQALLSASAGRVARAQQHIADLCDGDLTPTTIEQVRTELEAIGREREVEDRLFEERD